MGSDPLARTPLGVLPGDGVFSNIHHPVAVRIGCAVLRSCVSEPQFFQVIGHAVAVRVIDLSDCSLGCWDRIPSCVGHIPTDRYRVGDVALGIGQRQSKILFPPVTSATLETTAAFFMPVSLCVISIVVPEISSTLSTPGGPVSMHIGHKALHHSSSVRRPALPCRPPLFGTRTTHHPGYRLLKSRLHQGFFSSGVV